MNYMNDPRMDQAPNNEWRQGFIWSSVGRGKHLNPYVKDSEEYEWWRRGWECHYYNEDPE